MYRVSGWYRPHNNSLMKNLNRPCGQINREQFVLQIYSRVHPLDSYSPATTSRTVTAPLTLSFSVTPKVPSSGLVQTVTWKIDGVTQIGQTDTSFSTISDFVGNGSHTVSAIVQDPTPFVRLDSSNLLNSTTTWPLTLSGQIPATLANWRNTYGADTAILSSDRLPNLIKYALGLAANVAATPAEAITGSITTNYFTLTIPRRMRRGDVTYTVQVSNDLVTWNSGPSYTVTLQDTETQFVVRDAVPYSSSAKRFYRLAVQAAP